MDSSEPQEPSYYEVALTNRQVLVAFVALLTCLLVAFLSGVWIGRGGAEASRTTATPALAPAAAEAPLEQLSFFNGGAPAKPAQPARSEPSPPSAAKAAPIAPADAATRAATAAAAPAGVEPAKATSPAPQADASDAMRENLEATMAANRESPAMKLAVGERTGVAVEPAGSKSAPAPQGATRTSGTAAQAKTTPAAAGRTFVQVYSSGNGERAKQIVAQLRKAGFDVVMAETPKGGGRNFRVRVGPYADRAAGEAAAIRLRRDHRLDTWVTDSP